MFWIFFKVFFGDFFLDFLIFKNFFFTFWFFYYFFGFAWHFLEFLLIFFYCFFFLFKTFGVVLIFFIFFYRFIIFFKLLRLLLNNMEVTTEHQKWHRISRNSVKGYFFARRAKKALAEGRSPPQEPDVCPCCSIYLLVIIIYK